MMSARFTWTLLALPLLGALSCGSESTSAGDVLVVAALEISPPELTLVAGSTGQLNATPRTSSGITVPNRPVSWSSDDPGIASVSNAGVVSGVASGTTRINAQVDGVNASVPVEVSPKGVATVTVAPAQFSLMVGETEDLTVTTRSEDGETLTGRQVTFASDNPGIATVSEVGRVTAVASGLTVITATVEGKSGTANVAVDALPASQLEFQNQPGTGAAGSPIPAVRVEVQNSQGGMVSEGSVGVTVALADNPTGATLSGTLTVIASNGVATFSNLRIDQAGSGYTLRATAEPLTPAESAPFAIVAGTASRLTIATQPSPTAKSGTVLDVQPRIQIQDAEGNTVDAAGVEITAVLQGSGATLQGDRTVTTNSAGLATFTDLALSGETGTYTVLFAAPGLTSVASNSIALTGGAPAGLALVQQPSPTVAAGQEFVRQPVVQLLDAEGNPIDKSGIVVTATIQSGGGTLNGDLAISTDSEGRATFRNLSIAGATGPRVLQFSAASVTSVLSEQVVVVAGPATALAITTQPPTSSASGVALSPAPTVRLVDAFGNSVDPATEISVSASIASGQGGALGGTTSVTTSGGTATFSNLVLTGPAGGFTLEFTAAGLAGVTSNSITLTAAPATNISITTQPSTTAVSGVALDRQPVLTLKNSSGGPVSGSTITATINSGPSGSTLANATAVTNSSGVATFSGLAITGAAGDYTFKFATGSLSVVSGTITISAPATQASALAIVTQPAASATSGEALSRQPVIQLRDGSGNAVAQSGVSVTVAIASGGGSLGGTKTRTTGSNGQAAFTDLVITGDAGQRTLRFSANGLTGVTSAAIDVAAAPPPPPVASKLLILTAPSTAATTGVALASQPVIQIADASGAAVSQASTTITAVIASGPSGASLANATATTNASGRATFSGLAITGSVGTYTIRFESGSLDPVTSAGIDLSAGAPSAMVIITQPPQTTANGAEMSSSVVEVRDGAGNGIGGLQVTAVRASGPGSLAGTVTRTTGSNGRATFNDLVLTGLVGSYTIRYSAPGGISGVSRVISLTPGPDVALAIITQPPATARDDRDFSSNPKVELRDGSGNTVPKKGVAISAALVTVSGSGNLEGDLDRNTDNGVATFNKLKIKGTGTFRIRFTSPDHTPVTSTQIVVEH
jgi:hypothetical protein